jgi:drug/metabolite transporter (DMT)-like permease
MTVFGIFAYNALTLAMRTGEVSVVTPFRYTRLVFAMLIGILVFTNAPTPSRWQAPRSSWPRASTP